MELAERHRGATGIARFGPFARLWYFCASIYMHC